MPDTIRSPRQQRLVERVTEARKQAGLTQLTVARRLGRHQPFVANIETGQRRVDLVELIELAEIIGLDLHSLIEELVAITD
ncbi:helix-turn-helix domain-containing protein [Devosia faecipullorum]|uniref:helix-turn-helix domain-containing protein n=1 Tax=Devosia faecipullorum TaxID=2755039 RepID=UPI00187B27B6|nr:helix-turn-helix transcriptional regulator [Devosia faecipullorum]MBE7731457.1 helix-turn-helix transcriptional regulator [Devosia faecipullorum]